MDAGGAAALLGEGRGTRIPLICALRAGEGRIHERISALGLMAPRLRDHRFRSCPRDQFRLIDNNLSRWIPAAYLLF